MTAVIFDMDGTLIDNWKYHIISWQLFFKKKGIVFENVESFFGKPGETILRECFPKETKEGMAKLLYEKELIYHKIYRDLIAPIPGLIDFLKELKKEGLQTAVATSAPPQNVAFTMDMTGLARYFDLILDDSHVSRGKPDPEIYLETAGRLLVDPARCVVFEDTPFGIQAARGAGMKVIGIMTTFTDLDADMLIRDYRDATVGMVRALIKNKLYK